MPYALVVLLALVLSGPAFGQVHVDIGINFPAPPPLVVVPNVPAVQYVPAAPANLFFYGGQYWVFVDNNWYVSPEHNGPWMYVAPQYIPRPVLLVPVRYYHVPPGHWRQWQYQAPPRWDHEWGQEWAGRRQWRDSQDDDAREEGRGRGRHRGR
jgi:hypothetical protein